MFGHIINNLLTKLGRSVWENLDLDRWYRPHCFRSVLATSVKILPYRPPARLIRTKYCLSSSAKMNSEVSVCCVLVTFTLLSFDFVTKIEMHWIYNEQCSKLIFFIGPLLATYSG